MNINNLLLKIRKEKPIPKWIFNIGDVGSDSYRNYNIRASLLTDGNLCVFYRGTIARNFFAMTLDPTTFELRTMSMGRSSNGYDRGKVDEFLGAVVSAMHRQDLLG